MSSSHAIPPGAPTPLPTIPRLIPGISMALTTPSRVLFFDVFGTCVDWRSTVTQTLNAQSHATLNSATASLASKVRLKASDMTLAHWGDFAQQWRDSYKAFTAKLAADPGIPWKTVDEHHFDSLKELMFQWGLDGLWTYDELRALSLVWHRLNPWSDSAQGITLLNQLYWTSTLSNGNHSLLTDLGAYTRIPFTHFLSAEMFGTYKPSPAVYVGAADRLGITTKECVMVAAHLNDLQAAKSNGMQVAYVERPGEEDWSDADIEKAWNEGWVDIWIGLGEGNNGFVTLAEKLGVEVPQGPVGKLSSSV